MQTKKDEVKTRLKNAAQKEFLNFGFKGASIRNIVKSADTTIGNFYNYFNNKEAIFCELVKEVYDGFVYVLENHNHIPGAEIIVDDTDISSLRPLLSELITKVLPQLNFSFILLIEKSGGTRYENSKQDLVDMMSQHFLMHIEEVNPNFAYPEIGKVLALQLIEGALDTLKRYDDFEVKRNLLVELMIFTITGMMGMLQGEQND